MFYHNVRGLPINDWYTAMAILEEKNGNTTATVVEYT